MFQRRQVKTRNELVRGEFGKRIDHLRHAAGYGARAVSAAVRPTLAAARVKVAPSAAWVRTATAQGWGSAVAGAAVLLPLMAVARHSPTRANRPGALEAGAGKLARMAMLVVSELVTNSVQHAGGCLSLDVRAQDVTVTIGATDGSLAVPSPRDADDEGGRGLMSIEALSAGWGVQNRPGGKRVWVRLAPYPHPASP